MSGREPDGIGVERRKAGHRSVKRCLREALLTSLLAFVILEAGLWITVWSLPDDGIAYVLAPRGWGWVLDFACSVGTMAFVAFLLACLASRINRWLGCALNVFVVLTFVCAVNWAESNKCVAVVEVPSGFRFVRRVPFGEETVSNSNLYYVRVDSARLWRHLEAGRREGRPLSCEGVWEADRETNETLNRLVRALERAKKDGDRVYREKLLEEEEAAREGLGEAE